MKSDYKKNSKLKRINIKKMSSYLCINKSLDCLFQLVEEPNICLAKNLNPRIGLTLDGKR